MPEQDALDTENTEPTDAPEGGVEDQGDPEGADQLGDPGKKALDAMKGKWQAERDKRKALADQLAALQAESTKTADDQPDPEAIRKEAVAEATNAANERILRAEVKAAAAGKLADPSDAGRFLDLSQFEVDADGSVDADEIAEAIDELIKSKPYLAVATGPRFTGSADGGARKGPANANQLTENDIKNMTTEQIMAADARGQFNNLLGRT